MLGGGELITGNLLKDRKLSEVETTNAEIDNNNDSAQHSFVSMNLSPSRRRKMLEINFKHWNELFSNKGPKNYKKCLIVCFQNEFEKY